MAGMSVWGTLLGILGMVIALPATTIIIKWLKIWLVSIDREQEAATLQSVEVADTSSSG